MQQFDQTYNCSINMKQQKQATLSLTWRLTMYS